MHIRKISIAICLAILITSLGCEDYDKTKKEILALELKNEQLVNDKADRDRFIKNLNEELNGISNILDQVANISTNGGGESLASPVERVEQLSSLLDSSQLLIEQLSVKLENTNESLEVARIAQSLLEGFRSDLALNQLRLDAARDSNVVLMNMLDSNQYVLLQADADLKTLQAERNEMLNEIEITKRALDQLNKEFASKVEESSEAYKMLQANTEFKLGLAAFNELDRDKGKIAIGKKKKRKMELATKAWNHFVLAKKLGSTDALEYMNKMQYDKKINRYLGIKNPITE